MTSFRPTIGSIKTDIRYFNGTWRVKVFRYQAPAFLTGAAPRWCVVAHKTFQSSSAADLCVQRTTGWLQRVHSPSTRCPV